MGLVIPPPELIYIGIVGHEEAKFTFETEKIARIIIRGLLSDPRSIVVSGDCPLGGIDVWSEDEADLLGRGKKIFPPKNNRWEPDGFKARNIQIAEVSSEVNVIVVRELPPSYRGRRFPICYHCGSKTHIKSGACWTAKYAQKLGKKIRMFEI